MASNHVAHGREKSVLLFFFLFLCSPVSLELEPSNSHSSLTVVH